MNEQVLLSPVLRNAYSQPTIVMSAEELELQALAKDLSGKWEGHSIPDDKKRKRTDWTDCFLEFVLESCDILSFRGKGVSLWKEKSISFEVSGIVNIEDWSFSLTKTHKGEFKSRTEYYGVLDRTYKCFKGKYDKGDLLLRKRKKKLGIDDGKWKQISFDLSGIWEGESQRIPGNKSTMWKEVLLSFNTSMTHFEGNGVSEWNSQKNSFEISGEILDKFDNIVKGKIVKKHFDINKETIFLIDIDLNAKTIEGTYDQGKLFLRRIEAHPQEDRLSVQVKLTPPKFETTKPETAEIAGVPIYRALVEGMLASGNLTDKQEEVIQKYRELYKISDVEHEEVLNSLGVTTEDWTGMKASTSKNLCIVCFDNDINCVLLPCAHLALCGSCSKNLSSCPICRQSIQSSKIVYQV